jgi:transposase
MPAYSLDFRQKIIETYQQEKISFRQLARRFRVSLSFIVKLIKQWKQSGSLNPLPHGGGQKLKLSSEQIIILGDLVEQNNDATLPELKDLLLEKTGIEISCSTISRLLARLNFTRKKKLFKLVNVTQKECKI